MLAADHADTRADSELGLVLGVSDGDHVLVDVLGILDHVFLTGRLVLGHLDGLQRTRQSMGQAAGALGVVLPAKHLVDDVYVPEKIRYHPVVRLSLDVVEQDGAATVQVLL